MFSGGYHILFIPKDAKKTKRFHFSSLTARLVAFVAFLFLPLVIGSLFSALHYQNKVVALKRQMAEEHQVLEQKEVLTTRLARLERSLSHTEQSLHDLEAALDVEVGPVPGGLGPIEPDMEYSLHQDAPKTEVASLSNFLEKNSNPSVKDLRQEMSDMGQKIASLQVRTSQVYQLNQDKIKFLEATPNTMPVDGWITSGFGFRTNPYSGIYKMHYGIDVASPVGTNIYAPADGKVIQAEYEGGFGNKVVLEHGYGVTTVFGHASQIFVKAGDVIKKGEVLAAVGSTGSSTGPHVHYEVHVDGIPTDPLNYIIK